MFLPHVPCRTRQYKSQFKKWRLEKNIKSQEMVPMINIREKRRILEHKATVFRLRKREVAPEKIDRYIRRYKSDLDVDAWLSADRETTPPDVEYGTPGRNITPERCSTPEEEYSTPKEYSTLAGCSAPRAARVSTPPPSPPPEPRSATWQTPMSPYTPQHGRTTLYGNQDPFSPKGGSPCSPKAPAYARPGPISSQYRTGSGNAQETLSPPRSPSSGESPDRFSDIRLPPLLAPHSTATETGTTFCSVAAARTSEPFPRQPLTSPFESDDTSARHVTRSYGLHVPANGDESQEARRQEGQIGVATALVDRADLDMLYEAVLSRDAGIRMLLGHGTEVEAVQPDSYTALHLAVQQNDIHTAGRLLSYGANVNAHCNSPDNEPTPLHLACIRGNLAMVRLLRHYGADPSIPGTLRQRYWTPLHRAIFQGNADVATELLIPSPDAPYNPRLRRVNTDRVDVNGETALHMAAGDGLEAVVRALVLAKAHLHPLDRQGLTPLDLAVQHQELACASLLLRSGADPNFSGWRATLPIHRVARLPPAPPDGLDDDAEDLDIVGLLASHGADLDARDDEGNTPLMIAVITNNVPLAQRLLRHGAERTSAHHPAGRSPLHLAIARRMPAMVNTLLRHRAPPAAADRQQGDATCPPGRHHPVRSFFDNYLAFESHAQDDDWPALARSVQMSERHILETVRVLCRHYPDFVRLRAAPGRQTVLHWAARQGHLSIVDHVLERIRTDPSLADVLEIADDDGRTAEEVAFLAHTAAYVAFGSWRIRYFSSLDSR
ncbi:hypothetical protein GGTG_06706 [Gaeumannomyces tritici R3-111a-1]|uniref:Uncharacterized protein n=1 Tax=Gaeumannomyces tritici (strain R3-111a-1) TaxID=644352 RepID=J3NZK8_GAET3|nr:hypothetical protein GGTG_06706 [Gaeumannomyces tritici R3-111a-1]EJT76791.1 hypothetical protein GGTG_06706 [Gaeumannomyces tritici R3-111a-1]